MIVAFNARKSNSAAKSGQLLLWWGRNGRWNGDSDPFICRNDVWSTKTGEKKRLPFPSIRHSLRADGLPPVENGAGGWCIVKKKKISRRVHFLLSPLSPGNKPCKAVRAENGVCCASPHLTWQTCKNVCRQNEQIHDVWQEGGFC